jgi:N-acetyl-gamma-glutamyl-phosphate/LysW-gamma-L-alpha-aminoadipyl-6-phosphate reductase
MNRIRTVVVGASGYIGGEAVRLLLGHPHVDLVAVTGNESAGKRLDEIQPNLRGFSDLVYRKEIPDADAYVLSLPHGQAMDVVPSLRGKVVDLSGDFRLQDTAVFEKYYKQAHRQAELLKRFAYGIPEINREAIRKADHVAAGGCFASAAILSLWPLRDLADGRAVVDGKTGSSGSGIKPGEKTHHPFRAASFFGYEMFHHRHAPEIEQASGVKVLFQPHSTPLVRGVFTTSYVPLRREMGQDEVFEVFRKAYAGERFVRLSKGTANVNHVKGSNFVDLGVCAEGRTAIVFAALDNLIKGGAGQGVQCLNAMFGLPEDAGLSAPPAQP